MIQLIPLCLIAAMAVTNEGKNMGVTSSSFTQGGKIPAKYTCNGEGVSPQLAWSGIPKEAVSLVLVCEDPDAPMGTWDHWVLFNIPPTTRSLEEGIRQMPVGVKVGKNGNNRNEYQGPCPPDKEHRYFFRLYALDSKLPLQDGVSKKEVLHAMENHILAQAELVGTYEQPSDKMQKPKKKMK